MENRFHISNQTAISDLKGLVDPHYLNEINLNKLTRGFSKSELFDDLIKNELMITKLD